MNIKNQIETELTKYYDAFNNKNWEEFSECLDDDFKYFTDKASIQNKEEFINFLKQDKWKAEGYKISGLNAIASGNEDLVVSDYKIEFNGTFNVEKMTIKATETTVFMKKKNGWKIIHCHSSNG